MCWIRPKFATSWRAWRGRISERCGQPVSRGGAAAVCQSMPAELRAAMRAARRRRTRPAAGAGQTGQRRGGARKRGKVRREIEKDGVLAGGCGEDRDPPVSPCSASPLVNAFVNFVEDWHRKPSGRNRQRRGIPRLPRLFRAGARRDFVSLPAKRTRVRLMTAHAAKGLEFRHVAILRGSSTSFPCATKSRWWHFRAELRRSTRLRDDDKMLHEQEERRLFYVAMTRAKDTLAIYAKQGTGKKDPTPTQVPARVHGERRPTRKFWRPLGGRRAGRSVRAAEEQRIALQRSNVAAWLLMRAVGQLCDRTERAAPSRPTSSVRCASNWSGNGICRAMCPRRCTMERPCTACCTLSTTRSAIGREISDEQLLETVPRRPGATRASPTATSTSCICGRAWNS